MTAFLALVRKDLLLYLGDRRALTMNLILPIVLGAFFGYLFGGNKGGDNAKIEVGVVALDNSATARKIVAGLQADAALAVSELPLEQAREAVLKGKLKVAVVIPANFGDAAGAALFGGRNKPEITVFYDPSQAAVLAMVKGMLTQQVMQQVSAEMFGGAGGQRLIDQALVNLDQQTASDPQRSELRDLLHSVRKVQQRNVSDAAGKPGDSAMGMSMPFVTQDTPMSSGPSYNGYAHSFAGMAVQFILFLAVDAGIGVLLARRMGLWNRLLASPVSVYTVLIARAASSAIISFALLLLIFLAAALFFQVQIAGSWVGFLGVGLCFSLVTASFGLLIAAFGKAPEAARGIAIFATLIMVMLGGAWVPSFIFPQWLQTFSLVVPTRWAVDGFDAMTWRGLGLDAAWPAMAVQLGFATLFAALALWKFGREAKA